MRFMRDNPDFELRKVIYELLQQNPGLNLSKIAELLNISVYLAYYHLDYMAKNDLIIFEKKEKAHKRFYIKGKIGAEDRKLLRILRQETLLQIVLFLLKNPNSKHKDILKIFDIAPATLSYHLNKLIKNNIIMMNTSGEDRGYIVLNKEKITKFLILYQPSEITTRFKDTWLDNFKL